MNAPNLPIRYQRAGQGAPLVFVHGFACSRNDWRLQLEHFAGNHTVVACDLRGHGETPGEPGECSIERYGADVAALVQSLGLNGATLIGHSMGCRVVLQAYMEAPERIGALVLIDGSRIGIGDPDTAERVVREQLEATGYGVFARKLFADMFLPTTDAALREPAMERALQLPPPVGAELWARMVGWDARWMERALSAVKVPLLVIQSTQINAERLRVPLKAGESTSWLELVRQCAPAARIEIVTGVGHFTQLEAPDRVNRLIGACTTRS